MFLACEHSEAAHMVILGSDDGHVIHSFGEESSWMGPIGVTVDAWLNRVYVTNVTNHVIEVF